MENIPTYCEVKNGQKDLESIHPSIDYILEETQGIIVYQEQVMQIAQVMAGYSLGGADLLRRAMGKKIAEEMAKERPKFEKGAMENGVDKKKATEVFDLLEKFANYGFNKSHAAAYAVVSYQTAWLKANHPVEFMAGVMNCDIHLTDKLGVYFQEVKKGLGLAYIPPCVNRSMATFDVAAGKLVYGLGALKNVGVEAMKLIVEARDGTTDQRSPGLDPGPQTESGGPGSGSGAASRKPFVNLFDFARRCDLKRIGKRPLEMLARAGAFDMLDPNRRRVMGSLDALTAYSAAIHDQKSSNQVSLFGDAGEDLPEPRLMGGDDWLPAERLAEEFKAIGFYLSGHPLDDYMGPLKRKQIMTLDEVTARAEKGAAVVKMAGTVSGRQERKSARGNRFAFVQLSDPTGQYEVTMFSDTLENAREYLDTGALIVLTCEATMEADQLKLLGRSVSPIDNVVADAGGAGLRVFIDGPDAIGSVASILENAKRDGVRAGKGPVYFWLMGDDLPGEVELDLGDDFPVNPQIKGALRSLGGVVEVEDA
jgi:DNA polymerase-3 subunit alpha